ncbi:MAG: hypothetical protein ABI488_24010 [Polyangiaceae bacterium]
MKRTLLACALGAWLASACDVATVQQVPSAIAQNECQSSSECGPGECIDNQCRSRHGTLEVALIEVTPPANATDSAGLQFLFPAVALAPGGGELPLALDDVSRVAVKVTIPKRTCVPMFQDKTVQLATGTEDTIPASVTITPSQRTLGVSTPPAIAKTSLIKNSYYQLSADIPAGTYDVYVQPLPHDQACVVPPQVLRTQTFAPGLDNVDIPLPIPATFELHVNWPSADGNLSGWLVDMVDPVSGQVVSNSVQLALGTAAKTDYVAKVTFSPVIIDKTSDSSAQELLRLSPPANVTAPTILLARKAIALFDPTRGTLSEFTSLPTPVHVHGQVTALATPRPVAATVTLVATKITGIEPGVLASFVRTVSVADDGQLDVDLVPGTYRVLASPTVTLSAQEGSSEAPLSQVTTEWLVPSSPPTQAGKVIELSQALLVSGEARDSNGAPVATALVEAVASTAALQHDVLHEALGEIMAVPRASTGTVMANGSFNLLADLGTFDVSVRPQAGTGFAWSVVPAVGVGTTPETSAGVNLASLLSPLPVQYGGTVTVPGATADSAVGIPGALIRAYAYTVAGKYTSDPAKADSVVQIAETRADDTGGFKLLIPASLNDGAH